MDVVSGMRCAVLMRFAVPVLVLLFTGLIVGSSQAQDLEPRYLTPAPVGLSFVSLGYTYSTGAVLLDKTLPAEDVDAGIHTFVAAYGRSFDFVGDSARFEVIVPIADAVWDFQFAGVDSTAAKSGFGDPVLRFVWNFLGAPALKAKEFMNFQSETTAGVVVRLRVPLGQYDSARFFNLGVNRWMFSPRFGVSHRMDRIVLEGYASVWFFTDNSDFLESNTLSQRSLYALQGHLVYRFRRGLWTSVSVGRALGGETSVNGTPADDASKDTRVGLSLALPISRQVATRLAWSTSVTTRAGTDFSTFGIALQYRWSGQ